MPVPPKLPIRKIKSREESGLRHVRVLLSCGHFVELSVISSINRWEQKQTGCFKCYKLAGGK